MIVNKYDLSKLREYFIRRMTVDSETRDRRRNDFNQAIFGYREDGSTYAVWCETDMDMVLRCFDNAVRDWHETRAPRKKSDTTAREGFFHA